ncbi:MAG: 3-isopropylmalate dehydratase small subunit [Planctomycetota bacterium]|jgi:3-isopropylmalate/(R)-2-methylmalate dehydratase small subunit
MIAMAANEIRTVTARGIPLLLDDIDTDRIIPARYLRCVTFEGLGEHAFEDDRRQDANHPFDKVQYQGAGVLLAGRNFGCGSSREHAPQSLMRWGIRAIIAESFAEIFFGNCNSLGIPAVRASREDLQRLAAVVEGAPETPVTVNLETLTASAGDVTISVSLADSAREALVTGQWDYLGRLLSAADEVARHAKTIPYLTGFSGQA